MGSIPRTGQHFMYALTMFFVSALISGCETTSTWSLQYNEEVTVRTEPSGARIYLQDEYKGTSPVKFTLNGGNLKIVQRGTAQPLEGRIGSGYWTIKAHIDGYEPASTIIRSGETGAYRNAITKLRPSADNKLPTAVVGHNAILLYLPKEGMANSSYHGAREASYEQAKREYNAALSAYNKALEELDGARNRRSFSNMSFGTAMGGSKLSRVLGIFNQGATHVSLQDAKRNAEIVGHRLESARARLDAMN